MAFTMNTLTIKGSELLAAATAQNPLILDGCDACVGYIDQATAVQISARPANPASTSTNTSIIGADGSHVTGRAAFEAGVTVSAEVNTLYLYGHSASDPSSIFVIYISSDENTFHLPASGDVAPVLEILFTMNYASTANSVTVPTTSVYTTLSEFNLLKNRTVTTHAEGQATVGEAQDIYGAKTFKTSISTPSFNATSLSVSGQSVLSDTQITGDLSASGTSVLSGDTQIKKLLFDIKGGANYISTQEATNKEITIEASSTTAISNLELSGNEVGGAHTALGATKYSSGAERGSSLLYAEVDTNENGTFTIRSKNASKNKSAEISSSYDTSASTYDLRLLADTIKVRGNVEPHSDDTYNLGSSSKNFNNGYITNVYCDKIRPRNSLVEITSSIKVGDIYPNDNDCVIGSDNNPYEAVVANRFVGVIPTDNGIGGPAVGSILLVHLSGLSGNIAPWTLIDSSATTISYAKNDGTNWSAGNTISSGKYKSLSQIAPASSTAVALVIRVE